MGIRQRLLETPAGRVPPELAETVRAFSEPLEPIVASFVGLTEVTEDFQYPRERLAVAFELRPRTVGADEELKLVADRFYESMPEDVVEGGCNILQAGAVAVWREKAQRVFAR